MTVKIGEKAPNFGVSEWVQGAPTNFDQEKDHIVLLEVFQVNCPGCFMHAIPEAINIYEKYKDDGVRVLGLATQNSDSILSDTAAHRHPGKYPVHESSALEDSVIDITVVVQGLGHGEDIYGPKGIETAFTLTPVVAAQTATSTEIRTADNSGMSMDCQESLDCYTPSVVTVNVGDVVTMINSDSTAAMHSFTAGTVDGFTPSPSGVFDTGIMNGDDVFEWTPESSGEVPYYCLLHTWMQGTIIVN